MNWFGESEVLPLNEQLLDYSAEAVMLLWLFMYVHTDSIWDIHKQQ